MRRPDLRSFHAAASPLPNLLSRKLAFIARHRAHGTIVIVVGNSKGGCGKSTFTLNIAAAFLLHAKRVLIIDCDHEQGTCANWPRPENAAKIEVVDCEPDQTIDELAARIANFDIVIIDVPGRDERAISAILSASDILVSPTKPCDQDMGQLHKYIGVADAMGVPHVVVFNEATRDWTAELDDLAQRYAVCGPFLPVAVQQLAAYRRIYSYGRGVAEIRGVHIAKANFDQMFRALLEVIDAAHAKRNGDGHA